MNRLWIGAAAVAVLALSGCDDDMWMGRAQQDFHYSYAFQPGGRFEIENSNGSVTISGWDRDSIDVSGTKYAHTDERLNDVQIKVKVDGNIASVKTETPSSWEGGYGARYLIHVPRRTVVGLGHTTNGSVSVEDLQGGGRIESTNGKIALERDEGDYDVETTNGSIELSDCAGNERARTTNGAVRGRLNGSISAGSTNGAIDLSMSNVTESRPLRLSTTNGSVVLALAEFRNNPITVETTHGSISLRLPADTSARVEAHTSLSSINTDLPLSSTDEISKHELRGQLGKGGSLISATTSTGSIHFERY